MFQEDLLNTPAVVTKISLNKDVTSGLSTIWAKKFFQDILTTGTNYTKDTTTLLITSKDMAHFSKTAAYASHSDQVSLSAIE